MVESQPCGGAVQGTVWRVQNDFFLERIPLLFHPSSAVICISVQLCQVVGGFEQNTEGPWRTFNELV